MTSGNNKNIEEKKSKIQKKYPSQLRTAQKNTQKETVKR